MDIVWKLSLDWLDGEYLEKTAVYFITICRIVLCKRLPKNSVKRKHTVSRRQS